MKRKPFSWFDLSRLMQDPTYPIQLASELRYSNPQKLGEVLKDCVDILVAIRPGVKDYKNTRKRHFNNAVLSDLPRYTTKIKKLCQSDQTKLWATHPAYVYNYVEFYFDIDQLDLLALLTINSIDDAIAQAHLSQAMEYWETLQVKKKDLVKSGKSGEVILERYRKAAKYKQKLAGITSAVSNKEKAVADDLRIAEMILQLLSDESNCAKTWRSMNSLADALGTPINFYLEKFPIIGNETYIDSVSDPRMKSVIKEINHFDKSLLGSFVKIPIPEIKAENSRWRHYKIVKKFNDELKFHYLDAKAE